MKDHKIYSMDVLAWAQELAARKPPPTDLDLSAIPHILSLRTAAMKCGVSIRLASRDGRLIDMHLNPVSATYLVQQIMQSGRTGGWLDDHLTITAPLARLSS